MLLLLLFNFLSIYIKEMLQKLLMEDITKIQIYLTHNKYLLFLLNLIIFIFFYSIFERNISIKH